MAHYPADSTRRQRTPGRYRLADKVVSRMGYGAMQLSGDGVFGPARDRDEAIAVRPLRVHAGVDHIDTAQTYGTGGVNELIREALHPMPRCAGTGSKVAARCDEAGALLPNDKPTQLRADIEET
jgi:pyridoxine 4-dehydrogenase